MLFICEKNLIFYSFRRNVLYSVMAELTWTIFTHSGLDQLADEVNGNVSLWFRDLYGGKVKVVAVDFYRGTTIVESAIYWNLRKSGVDNLTIMGYKNV